MKVPRGLSSLCRKVPAAVLQQVTGFRTSIHRPELRPEQRLHPGSHKLWQCKEESLSLVPGGRAVGQMYLIH